ncbi:hypothetical protein FRC12_023011, partial [Ceratobasidium sp. 428]
MFGPGGYDQFIADIVRDFRAEEEMDCVERNNAGSGSLSSSIKKLPQASPKQATNPKKKK